jgi:hypothetical protein
MSLSPASPASHRSYTHCAHPSGLRAPLSAACTRSGFPDRNTCTACTSAAQSHISDTALSLSLAAPCRIAHSAKLPAFRACLPAEDRRYCLFSAPALQAFQPCAALRRGPDTHADGICDLTQNLRARGWYCLATVSPRQVSIATGICARRDRQVIPGKGSRRGGPQDYAWRNSGIKLQ